MAAVLTVLGLSPIEMASSSNQLTALSHSDEPSSVCTTEATGKGLRK